MASTDARPVPLKSAAYRVYFPILDADGDTVTGAASLDSEVSLDGASFADCTNEATEIGSSGMYYLDLTSGEMAADAVVVVVKTATSGAKTTPICLYPQEADDIRVSVTHFGTSAGTFSSGRPEVNASHAAGTAWNSGAIGASTLASDTLTAAKIASDAITAAKIADGAIDAATFAAGAITAAAIAADAITDAKVASDVTIASVTGAVGSVTGAVGSVTGAVGSVTGNVGGNVTGSVGSVASGGITATSFAADAITAAKLAADVTTELQAGLATAANLSTLTAYVDTEVAAIKAVTDLLPNAGALTSLATAANLATVAGYLDTEIAAIKGVTDKVDTALELDGSVYRYTTNALEQAPTGGGAADGSGFTAIPWNPAWDAEVQSEATDALNAYDPPTKAELDSAAALLATAAALATAQTAIDAVGAKTTNLPSDPADQSLIIAATSAIASAISALNNLSSAQAQTAAAAALTAYDPPTKAELDTAVDALPTAVENAAAVLAAATANPIDANVQEINDVALTGDGSGTPWGPA